MRYLRCKCGKREAWTSMGVPRCTGCEKCGTTLDETPGTHEAPHPHTWSAPEWGIDPKTGERWTFVRCLDCMRMVRANDPALRLKAEGGET